MRNKRGQATGAAILVAIIAVLIVLYILFLPPEERRAVLEEEEEGGEGVVTLNMINVSLLEDVPGRLDYIAQDEVEHAIPTVNLNLIVQPRVLKSIDSLYIQKSLFGQEKSNITFSVDEPANVENMLLNFKVRESKGRLMVILNGHKLFDSVIRTVNIEPIRLTEYLQKDNSLVLAVSSPGIAFWSSNRYSLEDLTITGDILSKEGQTSKNMFILSSIEKNNLEKAWLKFMPECKVNEVGKLTVWINDYEIYSAVPDCGMPTPAIEFAPYYLRAGENMLRFKTELGNYLIDIIKVKTKLAAVEYPVYYFELSEERYDAIQSGKSKIRLNLRFVDAIEQKLGRIIINGQLKHIEQTAIDYSENIKESVVRGSNSVKIEPQKTLDIAELRVLIEEEKK